MEKGKKGKKGIKGRGKEGEGGEGGLGKPQDPQNPSKTLNKPSRAAPPMPVLVGIREERREIPHEVPPGTPRTDVPCLTVVQNAT